MKVSANKIRQVVLAVLSILSVSSCKEYLTKTPTDFLNPQNYYETQEQLEYARRGVYSMLGADAFYGTYTQWALGWDADEAYVHLASPSVGPWNYMYSTSDVYNVGFWRTLYQGVSRANEVLANLDKNPDISAAYRDMVKGEMLFLRAYYYFILVQYYGGVPLRLEPVMSPNDVNLPRSSIAEVYTRILEDMTAAEALVPAITVIGNGGAVSKSAVRGILARVNLVMAGAPLKDVSRLSEVKKWAKAVINDTEAGHALNPSYSDIFVRLAADQYDIKESIWEVEFWGNNQSDQFAEAGLQGSRNAPVSNAASATGGTTSYTNITAKVYNVYEDGDRRKWFNIAHFSYTNSPINGLKTLTAIPTTETAKYTRKPGKFRREYETYLPKTARTPQNVSVLRYTDVLMMYAEAENELNGPTDEIIEMVNQIRRRSWSTGIKTITLTSGGSGYTSVPSVIISGNGGAVATARISAGRVSSITLARDSASLTFNKEGRYDQLPQVTLSGGGGSGATAVATIYSLDGADLKTEHTASKEAFRELIKDERMREFAFEGHRKADLLRWGDFLRVYRDMGNQVATDVPATPRYADVYARAAERDLFMPIPSIEVITNRAMVQNPGW